MKSPARVGAECVAELPEARDKVGNSDFAALAIDQQCGDDRGVAHIFGLVLDHVVEHDVGESLLLLPGQQSAENRVAVEAAALAMYGRAIIPAAVRPRDPRITVRRLMSCMAVPSLLTERSPVRRLLRVTRVRRLIGGSQSLWTAFG